MTRRHHSHGDPTGDTLRVSPIQLPTAWFAFGCSLLVHVGGIGAFAYFSKLSDPVHLPRLQYARGETPVAVTVRFLSTTEFEVLSNPHPLRHQDSGKSAGQALTPTTGSPKTASTNTKSSASEHLKPAGAPTTAQEKLIEPGSAAQPISQAIGEPRTEATPPTPEDTRLVKDSGIALSPPQDDVVQPPPLKPINQTPPAPPNPPKTTSKEGIEKGARVLNLPKPKYPLQSRRQGEEGLVLLEVEVLPNGTAGTIRVLKEPGYPRLIDAAIAAARQAKFDPAMRSGHHIRTLVKIPFRFTLR